MSNQEIIMNEVITSGVYTELEVEEMILRYGVLPIKSYVEWKRLGFQVRKGEKSFIKCLLWNPKMVKDDNKDEEFSGDFYRKMTSLFTISQVEKIR